MEFFTILLSGLLGILSPAGLVIDSVAENAIRDQLEDVEQLEVRVDNAPSYQILQGKVQRVRIAGRGLFPVEALRIDTVEVETDAIAIDPERLQEGQAALEQPLQAGIRLVLKQADLNQALQSPEIAEQLRDFSVNLVSRSGAEELQRYDFIDPQVEFIGNDSAGSTALGRIRIQVILREQETQEDLQILAELGLEKTSALQLQIVEPIVRANGEPVPRQLIQPLIDGINQQLNLNNLETFGITARLLQVELTPEALNLAAFVQIRRP
ncbi:DUF2993 domain-containing protein [Oculatella sp. FACHB-28]|uniref:LmeA family phospholipid-binding protein n=1 Tax=Oculatella sp. FACHB-28 TaxID=2692845 RepID=UPI001681E110|nr:DUF2993 domain-containing protein [Oculatella sp. FACHB-28]MBD2056413.1 DUF2993 domain-containing protein [Oculatella sp. FACHB-28]